MKAYILVVTCWLTHSRTVNFSTIQFPWQRGMVIVSKGEGAGSTYLLILRHVEIMNMDSTRDLTVIHSHVKIISCVRALKSTSMLRRFAYE